MKFLNMTDEQLYKWIRRYKADDVRDLMMNGYDDEEEAVRAIANDMAQTDFWVEYNYEEVK